MDIWPAILVAGKDLPAYKDRLYYYIEKGEFVKSFFLFPGFPEGSVRWDRHNLLSPGHTACEVISMELNKLSNEAYNAYVQSKAKPSPMGKNMVWAFLVGGLICVIGQGLLDWYQTMGLSRELAGTAVSVTLIFLTALLTGIGVFDSFAKHAGAGTLVPITGFANAVVAPAMEFKQEGLVTGTAAKLFTVAGPVLVYGISASVLYGLILWLIQVL